MSPRNIKKQVKEMLEKPAAQIRDSGEKVARRIRETVEATRAAALKKLAERVGNLRPTDLMSRFGSLTFSELFDRLKKSEIAKHSEVIRQEVLSLFGLPTAEDVAKLRVEVEKLQKEVAALRAVKNELKKVAEEVKALKSAAKKPESPKSPDNA